MEWINDMTYMCKDCETIFKTIFKDECGQTNFCPNCASRNIVDFDKEEE